MRNSSLVEWFCAENLTGLKLTPKLGHTSSEQNVLERKNGESARAGEEIAVKEKTVGFVQKTDG